MREQRAKGDLTIHCDKDPTSGIEVSTYKPELASENRFFKGKCPFWWKKNRATKSAQEEVASKSRLCVEAAHESPIPAVRKPSQREGLLGRDPSEGSPGAKPASSLLRKLLCLKDTSSRPKKPTQGSGASPIYGGNIRCGPVAALSRTADPQGESPLRWKPRSETQHPVEVISNNMETTEATDKAEASWITKPWRTFRTAITSRVQRSNLPRIEKATEDGEPHIPVKPEASSDSKVDTELSDTEPKSSKVFPDLENKGSQRVSWHGLEIHRTANEDAPEPVVEERKSFSLEESLWEENPVLKNISEWENLQKQVYNLLGGNGDEVQDTAPEDEDLEGGGCGYWVDEEDEDLGDLAENPGGQGMLMATRDLGWLSSELLGNSTSWKKNEKTETGKEESDGKAITVDANEEGKHHKTIHGQDTDMTHIDTLLLNIVTSHHDTSRTHVSENEETLSLKKWEPLTFPELSPTSFPTRALEKGLLLLPKACDSEEGVARKLLASDEETTGFATWHNDAGIGDAQDKQLIYQAAAEIVGAAIDAAAGQLAQKEEEGRAESELNKTIP
ncbi:uncharacterized protein LOC134293782 [Anolis carolinensis]|uniref:uncharacterized protein LOC134293782 n=1 Tax=Anolis carolinensis TaxID=28377 RepID=UPI002F2B7A86